MNTAQKERIRQLRMEGVTYEKIADCLDLSVNTVKSFCQRNQLGGRKKHTSAKHTCKQCGAEVKQLSHRKEKKFCSDKCRLTWWNSHPEKMQHCSVQSLVCPVCGNTFSAYSCKKRKYWSRTCYGKSKTGGLS